MVYSWGIWDIGQNPFVPDRNRIGRSFESSVTNIVENLPRADSIVDDSSDKLDTTSPCSVSSFGLELQVLFTFVRIHELDDEDMRKQSMQNGQPFSGIERRIDSF